MGVIKNCIRKILLWCIDDNESSRPDKMPYSNTLASNPIRKGGTNIDENNNGMHFTIYNATGGKVIQIRTYDMRTDRSTSALHIITDKEDLGVELGLIITRESLTR